MKVSNHKAVQLVRSEQDTLCQDILSRVEGVSFTLIDQKQLVPQVMKRELFVTINYS